MSIFDAIGDVFANEASHVSDLLGSWTKSPGKTLAQFGLGAQDPIGAKLWSGVTGTKFTPSVGQFGGETAQQFNESKQQGVNTGPSQTLGQIANVVAAVWGGSEAGGALGGALGGSSGGGVAASAGAGSGTADVAGLETADSAAVASEGAEPALTGSGGAAAGGGASTSAGAGSSSWLDYAKTAGKVLAPTVVSSLLQPKPPKTKAPTAMPDPLAQQQATQQKLLQQLARRGRASTILTSPGDGGGALGG